MKKIVHLIFNLDVGGAENMLIDVANEQALYADVTIILINNKFNPELIRRIIPAVHFFSLNRVEGNKRSILFLLRLWIILFRKRPDVIHCHNHEIIRLLPLFKRKVVLTVHCVTIPSLHFSKYKRVYSVSRAVASEVENRSGITSPVIINGIRFHDIVPKPGVGLDKEQRRVSAPHRNTIRLVQVARLKHEMKGQDLLLIALRNVLDMNPHTSFTVDFIGTGKSEPYLRNMTSELGLDNFVSFLGNKPRPWIYNNLHAYDILVHPSRYEAFGLAMIEGIAAGLPVIASDEPGPAEILSDKPTGYFFKSGDARDLARVIQSLSRQLVGNILQERCTKSRVLAEEQYSIRRTAHEYMKHYSSDLRLTVN